MKQKTIFFDLDDTLYDRFIPYQKAFRQFFGDRYAEKAPQAFDAVIHRGYEVFAAAHTGKISMRQMHVYRHQTGLADVGIAVTEDEALQMQALYAAQQRQITLTDTMRQVLDFCKTHFDMKKIKNEEDHYVPLPKIYEFKNDREKEIMLNRNFKRVNQEIEDMVKELLGMS